ncbi:MAG: hypothetical protein J6J60_00970, partial [Clostridia bacterium]|nr:hypothetical protein [Clostridia bacterium]
MKIKVNKKKTAIILFLIVAVFICGNAIAALLGAPNIFFAIREVTDKDVELKGKDVILLEDEEVIEEIAENEEELEEEVEEESEEKIKDTKEETEINIELSKTDKIFKELISEYEGKVYDDSWHKYDIKSVESVKTEF